MQDLLQRVVRVAAEAQLGVERVEVNARRREDDAEDDERRARRPPRSAATTCPRASIVQPAMKTAAKTMTHSDGTSR